MTRAMIARVKSAPRARAIAASTIVALTVALPGMCASYALAAVRATATTTTRVVSKAPSFPIPASERLGNATAKATATTTTAHPTTTTPASALPTPSASPTPNPGAGTGTAAKPSTSAAPATTSAAPAATTVAPTRTTPSATGGALTPAGVPLARTRKPHGGPSHLSTTALIAAILAALLVIASAIWVLLRWLAPEPRWTRSLIYSVDDASFRASATWSELLDWARLGR